MFDAGDIVDNRYEVVGEIGRGGMGVVLRVRDRQTGEVVALKYCSDADIESRRRFAREARVMAGVSHKHVMPVLAENANHSPPYFTMPIAQHSIAEEITQRLTEEQGLEVFKQICSGVQAIHNASGAHRDIKPQNAMRMVDGRVVVSDLGLAKLDPRDTTTLTQTSAFLGTRLYSAPEQLMPGGSRDADERTDVYQLGKTLYELLSGEPPALINPARIPRGLAYIVARATREHPDDRYQTVGALLDAVETYLRSQLPGASPSQAFEAALQRVSDLGLQGRYEDDALDGLVSFLAQFGDDPQVLIEQFARVPDAVLSVLSRNFAGSFRAVLELYCRALDRVIGGYSFQYAEVVAKKMEVVFQSTDDSTLKAQVVKATLIAAVDLNRFAAMEVFDSMLLQCDRPEDGVAIADVLRDELERYRRLADRIPRSKIHASLRGIYDEATRSS